MVRFLNWKIWESPTAFLKTASVNGLSYIANEKITYLERFLWFLIETSLVVLTVFIITHLSSDFLENPIVTTLDRRDYLVEHINFPGLAVCDVNKISRKKANIVADELVNVTGRRKEEIMESLLLLGRLFDYNTNDEYRFLEAQEVLDRYFDETKREYSPYLLLRQLETSCSDLLKKCFWLDKEYNCSILFQYRITFDGFCCTFNYARAEEIPILNESWTNERPRKVTQPGFQYGINILVNNNSSDYLYPFEPIVGVKVILFNPEDYPDRSSGGLTEFFCQAGVIGFLDVNPYTIHSVVDVRRYPLKTRGCSFKDELATWYGKYSYSNCLVHCKAASMMALCGCVPFQIPTPQQLPICTLTDVPCLNKYNMKWNTIHPVSFTSDELDHEMQDSLLCEQCYNSCSDTIYRVNTNFSPRSKSEERNNTDEEMTVINIYFKSHYSYLYKQDVLHYWFEILSIFGGLLGMFLGCSLITFIEFLYFFVTQTILLIKKLFFK